MTPPCVSVMKLINRGTGVEQVLTMPASLIISLSSESGCPIIPSLSQCGLIRLNYMEVLLFIIDMGRGLSSQTLNKY